MLRLNLKNSFLLDNDLNIKTQNIPIATIVIRPLSFSHVFCLTSTSSLTMNRVLPYIMKKALIFWGGGDGWEGRMKEIILSINILHSIIV